MKKLLVIILLTIIIIINVKARQAIGARHVPCGYHYPGIVVYEKYKNVMMYSGYQIEYTLSESALAVQFVFEINYF